MTDQSSPEGVCPDCGSPDLAHYVLAWGSPIPPNTEGFIGCRQCLHWRRVRSAAPASTIFDPAGLWEVIEAGEGTFSH